jgi:hypothetical protein
VGVVLGACTGERTAWEVAAALEKEHRLAPDRVLDRVLTQARRWLEAGAVRA